MKSITMLKFKVAALDGREDAIAELCRRGRNAGAENWLLRNRGFKESQKQKDKSESTKIYHAITAAVPEIGSSLASSLARSINSYLGAKVDWRRGEKQKKRRDAVLCYQDRVPFFTDLSIPVLCKTSSFTFTDRCFLKIPNALREEEPLNIELSMKKVPAGKKKILRDIIEGRRKQEDSKLVCKDGTWFLYLSVTEEVEQSIHEGTAMLRPMVESSNDKVADRPFVMTFNGGNRPYYVGDGRFLLAQAARFVQSRKCVGYAYRNGRMTGHGRKKIDRAVSQKRYRYRNIVDEVRRQAIVSIVRACQRNECGTLEYHEPTGPAKEKCWFSLSGIEWDWTRFAGDLKNRVAREGISVSVKKFAIKDAMAELEKVG